MVHFVRKIDDDLFQAARRGEVEECRSLITNGADPRGQMLHELVHEVMLNSGSEQTVGVFQALVDGGADPNARDYYGRTPLYASVANENSDAVYALACIGADPEASSKVYVRETYDGEYRDQYWSLEPTGADGEVEKDLPTPRELACKAGQSDWFEANMAAGQARRLSEATSSILTRDPRAMLAGMSRDQTPVASKARRL